MTGASVIETLYTVRCSGGCGRGLSRYRGEWSAAGAPELWDTVKEARAAALDAGWLVPCSIHPVEQVLLGAGLDPQCQETLCPDCRVAIARLKKEANDRVGERVYRNVADRGLWALTRAATRRWGSSGRAGGPDSR